MANSGIVCNSEVYNPDSILQVNGEAVSLSVGLYSMVREKTAPKFVYRWGKDNSTEVKTVTRKFVGGEDGSGDILLPSDIKKGIAYGGRSVQLCKCKEQSRIAIHLNIPDFCNRFNFCIPGSSRDFKSLSFDS